MARVEPPPTSAAPRPDSLVAESERDVEAAPSVERPTGARRRPSEYATMFGLLALVYAVVFGWILIKSDGLPYIFDNNESFSSLWHASNMLQQDASRSFWLTDEAYGPDPDAHPFIHTHQGNMPRLFAFVLYLFGAQTIETQIVATTATAGVLALWLLYHVLAKVASPRFALLAGVVFLTDYLFFAQWQVVTYRVWHTVLLFAALTCVLGLETARRRWPWLVLTFVTYLLLFYYELIFVAFVSIFAGLFLLVRNWRRPKLVASAVAVQVAGGVLALTILVVQLVGYLGWDGLREDLYLTYVARNLADQPTEQAFSPSAVGDYFVAVGRLTTTDPEFQTRLARFYDGHNIVFWWNLVDSRPLRTVQLFVGSLFIWIFQVYTPLMTLLVALPLAGAALGALLERARSAAATRSLPTGRLARGARLDHPSLRVRLGFDVRVAPPNGTLAASHPVRSPREQARREATRTAIGIVPLVVTLFFFLVTLFRDTAYLGTPISSASFVGQVGVVGVLALVAATLGGAALLAYVVAGHWRTWDVGAIGRLWLVAALFGLVTLVIRSQSAMYDQVYAPVWFAQIEAPYPQLLSRLALLSMTLLTILLVLFGPRRLLGSAVTPARRILPLLACSAVAFTIVYYLAAGYVLAGYLIRFSPLPVFVVDVAIGLAVWIVLATAVRSYTTAAEQWRASSLPPSQRTLATVSAAVAVPAFVLLVSFWAQVQFAYVRMQPPDQFAAFFKMLAQPPYRGSSVVVSMYAAPVAWQVQQWAYFDPVLGTGNISTRNDQVYVARDMSRYLWLADKHENPAYQTPDYYICLIPRSLWTALDRATNRPDRLPRCSDYGLVQRASAQNVTMLKPTIAARDPSDYDAWAVVKLDWQLPPGLRFGDPREAPAAQPPQNNEQPSRQDRNSNRNNRRNRSESMPPR